MPIRKKATIREVAATAGVSLQTVSRVLNDHPYVADATRQRVMEAIKALDYRPDAIARSLINRRSYTLGVVAAEVDFYGPQRLLVGIEKQSAALGYSLLLNIIHHHDVDSVTRLLDNLLSHQVDGIIWTVPEIDGQQAWLHALLRHITIPMVVTGRISHDIPTVFSDNRVGGRLATEHLLAQGYQHIGLITGPRTWTVARERQFGWQDALTAARRPIEKRAVIEGDWSSPSGEQGLYQLIEQFPELDAVFTSNDQAALGVLQAAHVLGLRVPEDLAVVGYDCIPESAYFWPPLTSVRQRLMEVGSITVHEMARLIECKQRGETCLSLPHIGVQPEVLVRKSSLQA